MNVNFVTDFWDLTLLGDISRSIKAGKQSLIRLIKVIKSFKYEKFLIYYNHIIRTASAFESLYKQAHSNLMW
jgi:hypothetical protein